MRYNKSIRFRTFQAHDDLQMLTVLLQVFKRKNSIIYQNKFNYFNIISCFNCIVKNYFQDK